MTSIYRWGLVGVLAALLLACSLAPGQAAGDLIAASTARDLVLPAALVPAEQKAQQSRSMPLTDKILQPLIGRNMLALFHKNTWLAGYHGWLNAVTPTGAQFATYDLYGFGSVDGARISRQAYQSLVVGTLTQISDDSLPKSAAVWTDTGTFGPTNQPYASAEIVFRVANVMGDVTGFYAGADTSAVEGALHQATIATNACVHWLSTRQPHANQSLLPLAPALLAPGLRPRWRRR